MRFLKPMNKKGIMESVMDNVLYIAIIFVVLFFLLAVILPISYERLEPVNDSSPGAYSNMSAGLTSLATEANNLIPVAFGIIALILIFVAIAVFRRQSK